MMATPSRRPAGIDRRWLVTFADLAAVMLAFFVLMFSMSEVDTDKWDGAADAFNRRFDLVSDDDQQAARPKADRNLRPLPQAQATNLAYLATLLERQIASQPALRRARVSLFPGELVISMPHGMLFDPEGQLRQDGRAALFLLGGFLGSVDNRVDVVGHATLRGDESPWIGALSRAAAVAAAMRQAGYRSELRALGYGRERTDPALPPGSRLGISGRIDLILAEGGEYQ